MTMTFGEDASGSAGGSAGGKRKRPAAETSLQRRIRLEREGRERGRVPSKAELVRTAEAERDAALSRSLFEVPARQGGAPASKLAQPVSSGATTAGQPRRPPPPAQPKSKGFAMMARMGFVAGQALGRQRADDGAADGGGGERNPDRDLGGHDRPITEPIRIQVKRDRAGIGAAEEEAEEKKKAAAAAGDSEANKRPRLDDIDPLAYRDRIRQERETERLERQVHAAQAMAARMAGEGEEGEGTSQDGGGAAETDLSAVNVLWRGLAKARREKDRERALRRKAQQLLDKSLRGRRAFAGGDYTLEEADSGGDDDDDDDDDNADRLARGQGPAASFLDGGMNSTVVEGGDGGVDQNDGGGDGDAELAAFEALPPRERLQQIVDWLREHHHYCFWCKYTYPDSAMDGCPGRTEEDHD